jgi:hypothetical protein
LLRLPTLPTLPKPMTTMSHEVLVVVLVLVRVRVWVAALMLGRQPRQNSLQLLLRPLPRSWQLLLLLHRLEKQALRALRVVLSWPQSWQQL